MSPLAWEAVATLLGAGAVWYLTAYLLTVRRTLRAIDRERRVLRYRAPRSLYRRAALEALPMPAIVLSAAVLVSVRECARWARKRIAP